MRLVWEACLTILIVLFLFGCASNRDRPVEVPELTYKQTDYVIGIGDQLEIDVWRNADLSRNVTVRPDGYITMPLMGDVVAENRTPEALAEVVSAALEVLIRNPEVTVTVANPVSISYQYRVRAMGQVVQPVSVAFVEGMTVMDLVLAAGGLNEFAAGNRAKLSRLTEQGYREYSVYLKDILEQGDIATNFRLQPSDILTVPEKSLWRGEF